MSKKPKEIQVEFAPGAFDQFDGTQEELDELMAEIQKMFAGKTREEIEAMSRPLTEEDFEDMPDDVKAQFLAELDDDGNVVNPNRRLQ